MKYEQITINFWENNLSVLDIAIDLMIKLVRGHFLSNGNKRLVIISCGAFLAAVGLYLKWNSNKIKYLNHWEKLMLGIAEGKISKDIDEIKEKMCLRKIFQESLYLSSELKNKKIKEWNYEKEKYEKQK